MIGQYIYDGKMINCEVVFGVEEVTAYLRDLLQILYRSISLLLQKNNHITELKVIWFVKNVSASFGTFLFSGDRYMAFIHLCCDPDAVYHADTK